MFHGHRHFRHGPHGHRSERFPYGFGGPRGRGDLKYEILEILAQSPRHGYDIMLAIEQQRGVRPSPGSIYPALQMLEEGEFIRGEERDGKRVFTLTEKGRELLSERPGAGAPTGDLDDLREIVFETMRNVHAIKDAARQIARSRNADAFRKAGEVLERTRRDLYAILAEHG
ncbi:MAG: PadR family transcriptional regulator [Vulcanimicrobiaceae bacterium]